MSLCKHNCHLFQIVQDILTMFRLIVATTIRCTFSTNLEDNVCPKAHSPGELDEWIQRYKDHTDKMRYVYEHNLHSQMEVLFTEFSLSDAKDNVVSNC